MNVERTEKSLASFSFRQLFRDIVTYGTGSILVKAVGFFIIPIYTRVFSPIDMGLWGVVSSTVGLISGILILGGDSAYARYYFEAGSDNERQCITSTWFTFLVLWSIIVVGSLVVFAGPLASISTGSGENVPLIRLALIALPVSLLNSMCGQALRNQFKAKLFTILNSSVTPLNIALTIVAVVVLKWGVYGAFAAILCANLLILPVRLWSIKDLLRLRFRWTLLGKMLAYGVPLVPVSVGYWLFGSFDRVLLGRMSGLDQVGLYSIAAKIIIPLALVRGALGTAWSPRAFILYKQEEEKAHAILGRSATYIIAFFGILVVLLSTFAQDILVIFTTPDYYSAGAAIAPLALGLLAYTSTRVTAIGISFRKKTYYTALLTWLTSGVSVGLNLLLIPQWGMLGAAWANMISYTFLTLAYLLVSQQLWKVAYEKHRVLTAVGLTFLFSMVGRYIPHGTLFLGLVLKSIYCVLFIALLFLFRVFDEREVKALRGMVRKELAHVGRGPVA